MRSRSAAEPARTRVGGSGHVVRAALSGWVDPEVAFAAVAADAPHAFWLDGGYGATEGVTQLGVGTPLTTAAAPLDALDDWLARGPASGPDRGFDVAVVGWIGYETGAAALGLPHDASAVDSALLVVDRSVLFDHAARTVEVRAATSSNASARPSDAGMDDAGPAASPAADAYAVDTASGTAVDAADAHADAHANALPADADADAAAAAWVEQMLARLGALIGVAPEDPPQPVGPARSASSRHDRTGYLDRIRRCQERIADGDAYQLCLTNRIDTSSDEAPLAVYRRLRRLGPSARSGLIVTGERAILSSSPETFLQVSADGVVRTRPIKGTRPRGRDAVEDAAFAAELVASEKERAENVMIVDLMRNDLGRVAVTGSVEVPDLFRVEAYRTVFQLVSTVTARLAPGRTAVDALRSAFPAGSMTGAPKLSAMRILHDLEDGPRGAYAGAFGYLDASGALELAMTIRTIVLDGPHASIGAGGGITALSDPEAEADEMVLKATPLLAALGAAMPDSLLG